MLFHSSQFVLFFPLVVALHFALPKAQRWILLLIASYYFYGCWKVEYLALIAISTLIDYFAALGIEASRDVGRRRLWLGISLTSNLGLLFVFKYLGFAFNSVNAVLQSFQLQAVFPHYDLLLPVGISFYTFQTLSYTIDVYRGQLKAERHLGIFSLYVCFFPQLVAGPIERSTHLMPQFRAPHPWSNERTLSGLRLILWGFFKKIAIADNAAVFVDAAFSHPEKVGGGGLLIATYLFAFQIFCDFSGYSDIAIGTARVFGYDLMRNFNRPYFAKSIREFWQRWHISLSTWFRDYLYIPLGGNRVGKIRGQFNLLVVFVVSGLWHGANWTFVVWGAIHGSLLILGQWLDPVIERLWRFAASTVPWLWRQSIWGIDLRKLIQVTVVFHLTLLAWVFFRAKSLDQALFVIHRIGADLLSISFGSSSLQLLITIALIVFMELVHLWTRHVEIEEAVQRKPRVLRWAFYYALILFMLMFGRFGNKEFIYFQF